MMEEELREAADMVLRSVAGRYRPDLDYNDLPAFEQAAVTLAEFVRNQSRDSRDRIDDRVECDILRDPSRPIQGLDPALLTWNDGTVQKMVDAMMNEDCDECIIRRGERYVSAGPESHWEPCVCTNGRIPRAEPQWDMMPFIADVLEEAGCTERSILWHLRGQVVCSTCLAGKDRKRCRTMEGGNPNCFEGYDMSKKLRKHRRGCWVIEALKH